MKKSRTRKAVEFLAAQVAFVKDGKVGNPAAKVSVYGVAKRFKLDPAGLSRAWKRFQKQKRCDACGQVIR